MRQPATRRHGPGPISCRSARSRSRPTATRPRRSSRAQRHARPRHGTTVLPITPTQQTLADIWSSVLHPSSISIHDNFFELGGDSILTIQVIARAVEKGLRFTPLDLAKHATVTELAQVIETNTSPPVVERRPAAGAIEPTPIQRWFLEQCFVEPNHWNQAFLLELPPAIDLGCLQRALGLVVAHHDALRCA